MSLGLGDVLIMCRLLAASSVVSVEMAVVLMTSQ